MDFIPNSIVKNATMAAKVDDYSDVQISVVLSLLAWPICYVVDTAVVRVDEDV